MAKWVLGVLGLTLALIAQQPVPAVSQTGIFPQPTYPVWQQTGRVSGGLNAAVTTARVALPTAGPTAYVCNRDTTNTAFLNIGTVTVTATTAAGFPLYPGWCVPLNMRPAQSITYTHLAAITSSSTAQLDITTGIGSPGAVGSSGISGGTAAATQGTSPWVDNVTQWSSTALGAPSNYGTSPGAVVVPGVNAFVTNAPALGAGTANLGNVGGTSNVTPTDCSGTITSGGTAQNAFAALSTVRGFTIQNLSTDPMWISFTGAAVVGAVASYLLPAGSSTVQGGSYSSPLGFGMNTALSVIAATTGDKWSCTRW